VIAAAFFLFFFVAFCRHDFGLSRRAVFSPAPRLAKTLRGACDSALISGFACAARVTWRTGNTSGVI
jgi:hypothetical protein